jgi:ATP-binding cassette, subfamily B, bacterial
MTLADHTWPLARVPEALGLLADRLELAHRHDASAVAPADLDQASIYEVANWIELVAGALDLETFHTDIVHGSIESTLRSDAPMLVWSPEAGPPRFFAVLACKRRWVILLRPDQAVVRVPVEELREFLAHPAIAPHVAWVDETLAAIPMPGRRRERVRRQLVAQQQRTRRVTIGWSIRGVPAGSLWAEAAQLGLIRHGVYLGLAHLALQIAFIAGWALIGRAVLRGTLEMGWLAGWMVLLVAVVALRLVSARSQAIVAVGGAGLIKNALLFGALRFEPNEVRRQGSGELVGKSMEASTFESQVLESVFLLPLSAIELVAAAVVVGLGASGVLGLIALLVWLGLSAAVVANHARKLRAWTALRTAMTGTLVEQLIGYRTRLVQQPRELWHEADDRQLAVYAAKSDELDRSFAMVAAMPRAWLVLGFGAVVPAFVTGAAEVSLAIAIGGLLLVEQAARRATAGVLGLLAARVTFDAIQPIMAARRRYRIPPAPFFPTAASRPGETVLELRDLTYRYGRSEATVFHGFNLAVTAGARVLVEGPSGAGKSTLMTLIARTLTPNSGLILYRGLDRETLGEAGWRRAIAIAPQFHENHVFAGTVEFNLLLGRWPARDETRAEAAEICEELGLGPVIARMPSGFLQQLGETGWQLSHGERSRLFIARALLQGSEVVVLDESFAALDPDTLLQAMECVRRRARTLIVVAHP